MVVGSGFVVAYASAMLIDPRETSLDHPNTGTDMKTGGAGDTFDDLHRQGENIFRPDRQTPGITTIGPDHPDGEKSAAQCGQESVRGVGPGSKQR